MPETRLYVENGRLMPELAFTCTRCGRLLATSDELTAHLLTHHHKAAGGASSRRVDGWPRPPRDGAGQEQAPPPHEGAFGRHGDVAPRWRSPARDAGPRAPRAHPAGRAKPRPATPARAARAARAVRSPWFALACAGLVAGAVTLSVAYAWAATHGAGELQYHLFWAGELLFLVPAMVRLLSRRATRAERLGLLVMVGLFAFVPKLLRDPSMPLFQDELIHWHQAQMMFATGKVFVPNQLLGIVEYFPGLQLLVVELRHLSGLSTFQIATVLLAVLHVVSLLGVFFLVERLTRSSWVAGMAALIYALNPGFQFFDSQFSYESLSIVLFVWVVASAVGLQTAGATALLPAGAGAAPLAAAPAGAGGAAPPAGARPGERPAWLVVGLVLAAACIVTHHLATYVLVLALVLIAAATAQRNARTRAELAPLADRNRRRFRWYGRERRRRLRVTALLALVVLGGAAAWAGLVATGTVGYLSPSLTGGLHQAAALLRHTAGARRLYAGTTVPRYERVCAFLTPALLAVAALGGLRLLRRHRRTAPPATLALSLFGLLYFAAVPFMLTSDGSEGARRTWAYSYLGLSVLIAPFLAAALLRARRGVRRGLLTVVIVAALVALLVGNVSIQVDAAYRFPGPYVYGSDTRSLTPELIGLSDWFRATQGAGRRIVADRSSALALANFGDALPAAASPGFPVWQLYFSTAPPDRQLVSELATSGYRYLVIDRRMARDLPAIGIYFVDSEPQAGTRTTPVPAAALGKYEHLPWVTKIYASDDLEVYRFDFSQYGSAAGRPPVVAESQP